MEFYWKIMSFAEFKVLGCLKKPSSLYEGISLNYIVNSDHLNN